MKRVIKRFLKVVMPRPLQKFCRRQFNIVRVGFKFLFSLPLQKKKNKISFEIHLAEHCNLNCAGCNNFSCIAEPELVDVEEFRKDFVRMGEIFNHQCERISLIGGEPLLHPEIITLMKIARDNFPEGRINIFTNGILLNSKDDDFWRACHDNKIGILISAYPINIKWDGVQAKAKQFGVSANFAWDQKENKRNEFFVSAINLAGDSNIKLNFAFCDRANGCITLKHGKLYTCTFVPNVCHFNKYFNRDIAVTEDDYIDIYKTSDPEAILQRLSEPIPACRYCKTSKPVKYFTWSVTKKDINEWL